MFKVNVGKYTPYMDPMGIGCWPQTKPQLLVSWGNQVSFAKKSPGACKQGPISPLDGMQQ